MVNATHTESGPDTGGPASRLSIIWIYWMITTGACLVAGWVGRLVLAVALRAIQAVSVPLPGMTIYSIWVAQNLIYVSAVVSMVTGVHLWRKGDKPLQWQMLCAQLILFVLLCSVVTFGLFLPLKFLYDRS